MIVVRMVTSERLGIVTILWILLLLVSSSITSNIIGNITEFFEELTKKVPSDEETEQIAKTIVETPSKAIHGFFESLIPKFTAAYGWNPFEGLFS